MSSLVSPFLISKPPFFPQQPADATSTRDGVTDWPDDPCPQRELPVHPPRVVRRPQVSQGAGPKAQQAAGGHYSLFIYLFFF